MLAHVRELTYPYRTACRKNRIANDALFARCPAPTPKSEDRKDIRPSAPASSERMRTGFRILMPNPSAGPAIRKLPSPDGTFPDFATSPTRIPHPYKVQHFPNRSGRRSRRPAIRPSRTGPVRRRSSRTPRRALRRPPSQRSDPADPLRSTVRRASGSAGYGTLGA